MGLSEVSVSRDVHWVSEISFDGIIFTYEVSLVLPVTSYIPDTKTEKQNQKIENEKKIASKCLLLPCVRNSVINITVFAILWAIERRIEKEFFLIMCSAIILLREKMYTGICIHFSAKGKSMKTYHISSQNGLVYITEDNACPNSNTVLEKKAELSRWNSWNWDKSQIELAYNSAVNPNLLGCWVLIQ